VAVLALAGVGGCAFDDKWKTPEGRGPSAEAKAATVDARAFAPTPAPPPDAELDLVDLLERVEDGSADLQQVRARVLRSVAEVDLARSALLPRFSVGATVLGYAKAPGTGGFLQQDRELFDLTLELSLPLDLSGAIRERIRAAQARYRAERSLLSAGLREQRFLAATAYFNFAQAVELRRVNEALVAAQERSLADARARFEAGVLRRNDVLTVEVTLAQTRQRGVEIETSIAEARRALNVAVGFPVDLAPTVVPWPDLIDVPSDPTVLLERARRENPEVDALVETREALLHELEATDRSTLPDVSVGPRATYTTESIAEPKANLLGFLALSWNPDLNGEVRARGDALGAQLLENAWATTSLLRRLEARILQAHRRVDDRLAALRTSEASAASARENLRIFEEQFRAGVATAREVLEAQALLQENDATLRTARHQVNLAAMEAYYVAGSDPLAEAAARRRR
ncbi:MAG TPA: TolC family protein, partial [Planctomycetota bacterium]|nr:TolC family protein [Planctomycetota bacterium]